MYAKRSIRDGSITIGPLPPGRTLFAFDRPPFAQTRLPNANVTGVKRVIEGGTITISPGSQLHVDVVDAADQPVPNHDVWIEDAIQPSPLSMVTVKTNDHGRATFDRLALGRYRVWTRLTRKCGGAEPTMSRLVPTRNSGTSHARMVIDGRAAFRITTTLGPVLGRGVTVTPDPPPSPQLVSVSGRRLPMPRDRVAIMRRPHRFGRTRRADAVSGGSGATSRHPLQLELYREHQRSRKREGDGDRSAGWSHPGEGD